MHSFNERPVASCYYNKFYRTEPHTYVGWGLGYLPCSQPAQHSTGILMGTWQLKYSKDED